jgi:predicted HTH domain antitoxin
MIQKPARKNHNRPTRKEESEQRMRVVLSDTMLETAQISAEEFLQEVAILRYQQKRLTLAQASSLANGERLTFQRLLASRQIAIHYDEHDLETDIQTIFKL